jgi:hypothetical protein
MLLATSYLKTVGRGSSVAALCRPIEIGGVAGSSGGGARTGRVGLDLRVPLKVLIPGGQCYDNYFRRFSRQLILLSSFLYT